MKAIIYSVKLIFGLLCMTYAMTIHAAELYDGDISLVEQTRVSLIQQLRGFYPANKSSAYTVLDAKHYKKTVTASRAKIEAMLKILKPYRRESFDTQVAMISNQLIDIPYLYSNGMGEGDWQPASTVYQPGAKHVKQNPVYRLDGLNCQTFVQVAMGLLYSTNLAQFDNNILKIAYGAAGNPNGEIVRYYNRNNFVDADFNPVNQRNGWLTDVTAKAELAPYSRKIQATITRQQWFLNQQQNLGESVQVLDSGYGSAMSKRFTTTYSQLNFPRFNAEKITLNYIPKEFLAIRQLDGSYQANQYLLDKIPTPAVAEIVRDVKRWNLYGIKIKDIIGSELTISHLGLLYRQTFYYGDFIYHKTTCGINNEYQKTCRVIPVTCQKDKCDELMFAHATDAYPVNFYWYQKSDGNFTCTSRQPESGVRYSNCNRVVITPFYEYLTDYQLGSYWNMDMRSVIGVHFEKIGRGSSLDN